MTVEKGQIVRKSDVSPGLVHQGPSSKKGHRCQWPKHSVGFDRILFHDWNFEFDKCILNDKIII